MKKAVIYARFSCSSQTEQSIEGQLRVCKEYAKRNDILIMREYIDRAKSGTTDARPSFQLMMKDCVKHEWDYVLVYKLDRFSRDKYDSAVHKHTLKQNGIKVISATENIPDSPEAIIFESVLEGFAQYYSAELSQKVKRGLKESYLKGFFTGGQQLFGYDVKDKKNVINEYEADIIKEIFTKYSNGITLATMLREINERGIKNKLGKPFSIKTLYKMLNNTKYNGRAYHNGEEFTTIYPKIIEDTLWNSVNTIHQRNITAHGDNFDSYGYILSGKLYCGNCGCKLVGAASRSKTGVKHPYYSCRSKADTHTACKNKSVRKQWIENLVLNDLYNTLIDDEQIREIAKAVVEYNMNNNRNTILIAALNEKKKDLQRQSNNVLMAIRQGIVTAQTKECLTNLENEIAIVEDQIETENIRSNVDVSEEDIITFFKSAVLTGIKDNIEIQKYLVNTFIKEIILYNDNLVIVYNYIPTRCNRYSSDINDLNIISKEMETPSFSFTANSYRSSLFPPLGSHVHYWLVYKIHFALRLIYKK